MALPTAANMSHVDMNNAHSLIGVMGTLGTADTAGTALTVPVGVNPVTGALYVEDLAGEAGTVTTKLVSGTLNVGTVVMTIGTVTIPGTVAVEEKFKYTHLVGNGTTLLVTGAGFLHAFVINTKSVGGVATIYDGTSSAGGTIATIDTTLSTTAFIYDVVGTNGITVGIAGATGGDSTVSFR